jgi:quercetin dioxygenase-like cupin family protein
VVTRAADVVGNGTATYQLALYSERLEPGFDLQFDGGPSVVFVRGGTVTATAQGDEPVTLQSSDAWVLRFPTRLVDGGATAWIDWWAISEAAEGGTDCDNLLLASEISLDSKEFLLRCDQVAFPPGGVAYTHTHAGPGIRRLISGRLRVDSNGESHEYLPGDAWFESGPIPVYAEASPEDGAAFLRVMVLPVAFKGKSSITYLREEDRVKPKDQIYSIYVDEEVAL